jgi:hypothetical protein
MNTPRTYWEENKHRFVTSALEDYHTNPNSSRGYDILRYAAKGVIDCTEDVSPQMFLDWYPLNMGYVILRLAKAGKLFYRNEENG